MRLDFGCDDCKTVTVNVPWTQGARVTCIGCGAIYATAHDRGECPRPRRGERVGGPPAGVANVVPGGAAWVLPGKKAPGGKKPAKG